MGERAPPRLDPNHPRCWPDGGRRRAARLVGLVGFVVSLCVPAASFADGALTRWRAEATTVRALAESDAPRAYREAEHLEAALPAAAPAADRARLLNVQARIEMHLGLTQAAAEHAAAALELATRNDDRIGQAEAKLNQSLNAINQGRIATSLTAAAAALSLLDGVKDRPELLGEAMLRTSMEYRRNGQPEASIAIVMRAMEMAQQTQDPLVLAYANEGLAITFEQSGRYEEALHHFAHQRDYGRAAGSRLIEAKAIRGMASVKLSLGNLAEAEIDAREAVTMLRAAGMPFHLGFGLYGLSDVLRAQGRRAEALHVLDEIAEIYRSRHNDVGLWWAVGARVGEHLALGNLAGAKTDAQEAYALARRLDTPLYLGMSARRLAAVAAAGGDYRGAYTLANEASVMDKRVDQENSSERILQLTERFRSESKQRHIDELTRREQRRALERRWLWTVLASSVVLLAATAGFLIRLSRSNRALRTLNAVVEESRRQLQSSEQTFRAVVENSPDCIIRYDREFRRVYINPSMLKIFGRSAQELIGTSVDTASAMHSPHSLLADLQRVIETGDEITQESAFYNAQGELRWGQTRLVPEYGPSGEVVSVLAIGRDFTTLVEAQHRLEESRTQLRELAARRETAREEERRRIAREIHDELGQQLTALRLKVNLMDFRFGKEAPALRETIGDLLQMVDRTIQVVRNVATSLRPAVLDMGIVPALDWLAAEFRRNTGIPCNLAAASDDLPLREEKAMVMFRTAQEALTNAARHAKASELSITIGLIEGRHVLEIADDGVGFAPDFQRQPKSFGLVGIHERALAVGGEAEISSVPGRGTTVRISIPLRGAVEVDRHSGAPMPDGLPYPDQPAPDPKIRIA